MVKISWLVTALKTYRVCGIPYNAKWWQGKTLANQSFQSFSEENTNF